MITHNRRRAQIHELIPEGPDSWVDDGSDPESRGYISGYLCRPLRSYEEAVREMEEKREKGK